MLGALISAPLVWLALIQTNYVLAYPACGDRSNWWLHVPGAVATVASIAVLGIAWRSRPGEGSTGTTRFIGEASVLIAFLFVLVVGATLLPPIFLHPCD
jgi:hypothetical protein